MPNASLQASQLTLHITPHASLQASQPTFLLLVAVGVAISSCSIFFLGVDDQHCGTDACVDSAVDRAAWNQTMQNIVLENCKNSKDVGACYAKMTDYQACNCEPANTACMGAFWTFLIGFAVSHSTLAMKVRAPNLRC